MPESNDAAPGRSTSKNDRRAPQDYSPFKMLKEFKPALAGGLSALVVAIAGSLAVGSVSSAEGRILLEAIYPTTRFLCSAVMTGSATILALMLTLLSLTQSTNHSFKSAFFGRIRAIALFDAITFVSATLLLMLHSIPLEQSENVPASWFSWIYYGLMSLTGLIGGMLVVIVLMLYYTTCDLIGVIHEDYDSELTQETDS